MARWLARGTHRLIEWETDLSSQTGASQAGILLGSNDDIPAFRWVEKETGTLRKLDKQLGRIARAGHYAPRPYEIVVLSDHGQTQGATFKQRNGTGWTSSFGCRSSRGQSRRFSEAMRTRLRSDAPSRKRETQEQSRPPKEA
jgi:hypothetical protein